MISEILLSQQTALRIYAIFESVIFKLDKAVIFTVITKTVLASQGNHEPTNSYRKEGWEMWFNCQSTWNQQHKLWNLSHSSIFLCREIKNFPSRWKIKTNETNKKKSVGGTSHWELLNPLYIKLWNILPICVVVALLFVLFILSSWHYFSSWKLKEIKYLCLLKPTSCDMDATSCPQPVDLKLEPSFQSCRHQWWFQNSVVPGHQGSGSFRRPFLQYNLGLVSTFSWFLSIFQTRSSSLFTDSINYIHKILCPVSPKSGPGLTAE